MKHTAASGFSGPEVNACGIQSNKGLVHVSFWDEPCYWLYMDGAVTKHAFLNVSVKQFCPRNFIHLPDTVISLEFLLRYEMEILTYRLNRLIADKTTLKEEWNVFQELIYGFG